MFLPVVYFVSPGLASVYGFVAHGFASVIIFLLRDKNAWELRVVHRVFAFIISRPRFSDVQMFCCVFTTLITMHHRQWCESIVLAFFASFAGVGICVRLHQLSIKSQACPWKLHLLFRLQRTVRPLCLCAVGASVVGASFCPIEGGSSKKYDQKRNTPALRGRSRAWVRKHTPAFSNLASENTRSEKSLRH